LQPASSNGMASSGTTSDRRFSIAAPKDGADIGATCPASARVATAKPRGTPRPRLANRAPTPLIGGFKRPCTDLQKGSSAMNNGEPALAWNDEDRRIKLHDAAGFAGMRRAGRLAAEVLDFITPHVVPGVTTGDLDRLCHGLIVARGAIPAPLNYRGFPKSICTSVNHVVCHGIPGDKKVLEGDIINIDVTVILDGWHGDCSRMYPVGKIGVKAQKLIDATYEAMM